jgi:hypothetical protein
MDCALAQNEAANNIVATRTYCAFMESPQKGVIILEKPRLLLELALTSFCSLDAARERCGCARLPAAKHAFAQPAETAAPDWKKRIIRL